MQLTLRPFRSRRIIAVAAGVALLFFVFVAFPSSQARPESALLEFHMNHDAIGKTWISNSSFDWSSVEFRYPPGPLRPLPTSKAGALPRIQHRFPAESASAAKLRNSRRTQVRGVFMKNWESYKQYAWMKDALLPLSATGRDQFSGWSATLVDSLDTLWIMGLKDEFDDAVNAVAKIDFGKSTAYRVNMFETNIRYLGGLLAAYDLSKRKILLTKATELGDLLYAGFNTEHRMPVDFIDFETAKTGKGLFVEPSVVSASPGTISMEFTRLSQLTGDPKYYDAISRVTDLFFKAQNETKLPGMWPMYVSMSRQDVKTGSQFTIAGNADSLYEYLPKMVALLGFGESQYETLSKVFMDTANDFLFFRPMVPGNDDILISGNVNVDASGNAVLDPESEHLACFIGGLFALAGSLFKRRDYLDIGSRLALGCAYAYRSFPTGMMPERYNMVACESRQQCKWDEHIWNVEKKKRPEWKEHLPLGFTTAKDPRYILRPEAIESIFVLWRITGRPEFQDAAWAMWQAVSNGTATKYANAAVLDVTKAQYHLQQEDYMESFWMAETLKYFYLVFSPPDVISLDDFVLNTEAHPFRLPR